MCRPQNLSPQVGFELNPQVLDSREAGLISRSLAGNGAAIRLANRHRRSWAFAPSRVPLRQLRVRSNLSDASLGSLFLVPSWTISTRASHWRSWSLDTRLKAFSREHRLQKYPQRLPPNALDDMIKATERVQLGEKVNKESCARKPKGRPR